jgi:hypothetical protein
MVRPESGTCTGIFVAFLKAAVLLLGSSLPPFASLLSSSSFEWRGRC